jgi:rubrerythrin
MNLEEAIKTALEYETKVRDLYVNAQNKTSDAEGKKIFQTLAKEEQGHLDYLNSRLQVWEKTGNLDTPQLDTLIPSQERIAEGVKKLEGKMSGKDRATELQFMKEALDAEIETSNFYKKMVSELSQEGKKLFARFLEIEEGHQAIVQAEIDSLSGSGFWFDFTDVSLEM